MCGEHDMVFLTVEEVEGSSPHVRGTRGGRPEATRQLGIIPACAGNTHGGMRQYANTWDHPRMCGEHQWLFYIATLCTGIIPACAGNTPPPRQASPWLRDHPRMCGEHQPAQPLRCERQGSSPHVRGTLFHLNHSPLLLGIIPACAGNTKSSD